MRQLRFIALAEDSAVVVLADDHGGQYRLAVDERVRAAVSGDGPRLGQAEVMIDSSMRPAEIQARLRSGESPEDIARSGSMPVERVLRFAGPVLQERAQVVQKARATSSRPLADGTTPVLGEAVDGRLTRAGMDPELAAWDAGRLPNGTWQVTVSFGSGRQAGTAAWVYDPRSQHVRPDDATARELLTGPAPEDPNLDHVARPLSVVRRPDRPEPAGDPDHGTAAIGGSGVGGSAVAASAVAASGGQRPASGKRSSRDEESGRRVAVPSWDDIVFGVGGQR